MKLSLSKSFLFFCSFSITSLLAMPMCCANRALAAHSPPIIDDALSPRDSLPPTLPGQVKLDRIPGTIIIGNIATIAADKRRRSQYTQDVVSRLNAQDPKLNYVICHVKHSTAFDGEKGKDWGHSHQEFDIKLGGTIGYEIYWAKSGTFTILGDGGYINWAYFGNVKNKSADGKVIVFGPR